MMKYLAAGPSAVLFVVLVAHLGQAAANDVVVCEPSSVSLFSDVWSHFDLLHTHTFQVFDDGGPPIDLPGWAHVDFRMRRLNSSAETVTEAVAQVNNLKPLSALRLAKPAAWAMASFLEESKRSDVYTLLQAYVRGPCDGRTSQFAHAARKVVFALSEQNILVLWDTLVDLLGLIRSAEKRSLGGKKSSLRRFLFNTSYLDPLEQQYATLQDQMAWAVSTGLLNRVPSPEGVSLLMEYRQLRLNAQRKMETTVTALQKYPIHSTMRLLLRKLKDAADGNECMTDTTQCTSAALEYSRLLREVLDHPTLVALRDTFLVIREVDRRAEMVARHIKSVETHVSEHVQGEGTLAAAPSPSVTHYRHQMLKEYDTLVEAHGNATAVYKDYKTKMDKGELVQAAFGVSKCGEVPKRLKYAMQVASTEKASFERHLKRLENALSESAHEKELLVFRPLWWSMQIDASASNEHKNNLQFALNDFAETLYDCLA